MFALSAVRLAARTSQGFNRALFGVRALLASLLLSGVVSTATAERLPLRTYTTDDGLAHSRVRRIVPDPRGFLWFCTIDGLSRFDGTEFVTYRNVDGLPDPWVTDLLPTRHGAYLVATNDGVVKVEILARRVAGDGPHAAGVRSPKLFAPVPFEGSPTQRHVRVLLEDRAGRIWAGAEAGCPCWTNAARLRASVPLSRALRRWSHRCWRMTLAACGLEPWTACSCDARPGASRRSPSRRKPGCITCECWRETARAVSG